MRLDEITRTNGAVDRKLPGLYNAQVGDIIEIGFEGSRIKHKAKIAKVVGNDRLVDADGNIFNRSGIVFRRKSYPLTSFRGKIISAKQMTQKALDNDHEDRKVDYLKRNNWENVDPETRDKILSLLRVSFTSMQGMKDYK